MNRLRAEGKDCVSLRIADEGNNGTDIADLIQAVCATCCGSRDCPRAHRIPGLDFALMGRAISEFFRNFCVKASV
jgi:hypothetical protein